MRKFLNIIMSLSLVLNTVGVGIVQVHANFVNLKVDCICVDKEYLVYGDVQATKNGDECIVQVNLSDPNREASASEKRLGEAVDTVTGAPVVEDVIDVAENTASFGTGVASGVLSPLGVLFQQSGMKESFVNLLNSIFKGHTEKYHQFIDEEIFGAAIAKISSYEDSASLEAYLKTQEGECKEDGKDSNPKPECVIERAMCSYEKYVGVLFNEAGKSLAGGALASDDLDTVLVALQNRDQAILDEAQHAQEALDIAIAVYAEFFQTYRLHLRFKELIVHLAKVRAVTGSMRELVGCIPNKFVGVATTKCN